MFNQRYSACLTQNHCYVLDLLAITANIVKDGNVIVKFFNIAEYGKATELKMVC